MQISPIRVRFKSILTGSFPEEKTSPATTIATSVERDNSSTATSSKLVRCNSLIQGSIIEQSYSYYSEVSTDGIPIASSSKTTTTTKTIQDKSALQLELKPEPDECALVPVLKKVIVIHMIEDGLVCSEVPDAISLSYNDSLDNSEGCDTVPIEDMAGDTVDKTLEHAHNQVPIVAMKSVITTTTTKKDDHDSRSGHPLPYIHCMGIDDLPDAEVGANADEIFLQAIVESMKLEEDISISGSNVQSISIGTDMSR